MATLLSSASARASDGVGASVQRWRPRLRPVVKNLLQRTRLGCWIWVIRCVRAEYRLFYGRRLALLRPRRYSEKMQWRKLFELDPLFATLSDKLAVRDHVTARIGPGRQAELLWSGADPQAIPFDDLEPPYILKSTHASGHALIVMDRARLDVPAARAMARKWLDECHGTLCNEPAYIHLSSRLVVERLLYRDGRRPLDRKVFVFNGRAEFIWTTTPDGELRTASHSDIHTRGWVWWPPAWGRPPHPTPLSRPAQLEAIIALAERLGAGMSHCRVDLYDSGDTLHVGELTVYTRSGLIPYIDPRQDFEMGAPWRIQWPALRACWAIAFRRWEIRPPGTEA